MFSKKKRGSSKKDFDSQFEAFLKESISSEDSSLDTARVAKYLQHSKKAESQPAWWMNGDDDSISETAVGLSGTGKSFLKKAVPRIEKDVPSKENNFKQTRSTDGFEVNMSRDSLDDMSLRGRDSVEPRKMGGPSFVPGLALDSSHSLTETATADRTHPGLETLQEIAEKERFFEDLQKNSGDSTIDYSRLNRDLDRSGTLQGTLSSEMVRDDRNLQNHIGPEEDDDDSDELHEGDKDEDFHSVGRSSPEPDNNRARRPGKEEDKSSMLSKVALMDSLDSTMGTKYASQETRPDDMKPIPEGHEQDELDGAYVAPVADSHAMTASEPTTKGIKTGTGFGFTDTSHEIEALQAAYRQVGMSATMGSTHDFTLQGSSSVFNGTSALPVGDSHATTGTADAGTDNLPGFGLKAVAHNVGASQRTVEDIIHEVDELRKTGEQEIMPVVRFKDEEEDEPQGFNLSPVHTQDEMRCLDLSPVHTASQPDHTTNEYAPFELYESSSSPIPIPAPRTPRKSERRPPKEKFPHVRSSGYGKLASPPRKNPKDSRSPKNAKNSMKSSWTPADTLRNKIKGTERLKASGGKFMPTDNADSQLVASVQSFASYIQSHFTESQNLSSTGKFSEANEGLPLPTEQKMPILEREKVLMKEVKEWQEQWREERKMVTKMKAELENIEREQTRKMESQRIEHEAELFKLKQENFVLSAKISESDSDSATRRKALLEEAGKDGVSKEQLGLLEKEIREQEGLLAGYQAENERLYQELKKMQNLSKTTEQQMFKENQRLNQEVSNLRQQLEQKEIALKNRGLITGPEVQKQIAAGNINSAVLGAGRIAQLEQELRQAKGREDIHKKEMMSLSRAKHEVEKQVDDTVKKISEFEEQIKITQATKSDEVKEVEARYEAEIEKLNRKIKWYAENQELLDRDHDLLKKKNEEIKALQDKTEHLNTEHGRRQAEAKARVKERASDARKIQDLQRQVREMESIIRKRHPNSLPVLMWAANAALENDTKDAAKCQPSVRFLEDRCKRLEVELESKDEEEKRGLRVMEQKYNAMKYQYEDRIKTLEMKLAKFENSGEDNHPHSHTVALQRELEAVRERYKKELAEKEGEIERMKKEVQNLKAKEAFETKAEIKASKEVEQELHSKARTFEFQLMEKEKERASLQVSLDRLQKEKHQLATELARKSCPPPKAGSDRGRRPRSATRGTRSLSAKKVASQESLRTTDSNVTSVLPPYPTGRDSSTERHYQPGSFMGVHIEDVLKENESLKIKVDRLQLEVEHSRINQQKMLAEAESRDRRANEKMEEQMAALKLSHQVEVQKILAEHAMSHATSRTAELQGQVNTQEVMIRHLREQLDDSHTDSEQLAAYKIRSTALETQVNGLLDELREAQKSHTPEMRHYMLIQDQIKKLEERHRHREQELKQIIHQSQALAAADMEREVEKWKKIVEEKNREVEKFRAELDKILLVLKELHRQGVVLPVGSSSSSRGSDR